VQAELQRVTAARREAGTCVWRLYEASGRARLALVKEDVLEQIVDDYLQVQGYFTTHNVRFNPPRDQHCVAQADSVPSDIDVVGLHPRRTGPERVMVVSCKSWQGGFRAGHIPAQLRGEAKNPKRARELQFRELWMPRWAHGFRDKIEEITGEGEFTYCLAVTRLHGGASAWPDDPTIRDCLGGNPFRVLTLEDMWRVVLRSVTTTPAASEMGRLALLLKAAGLTAPTPIAQPSGPQQATAAEAEEPPSAG
jgi:hypothetical protein